MKNLLPASLLISVTLLSAACIFGGESEPRAETEPNATAPARPAISRGNLAATPTPQAPRTGFPPAPGPARAPLEGEVSVVYSFPFIWPADGPITSFMSPEHPNGIDIGLENTDTLEVRAAAGGVVIEAGGDDEQPLGISIVIDHGGGVTTVYGHLAELRVQVGDKVEIGDVIGVGGSTGISTGVHLHLEVRKDGETVDPLHVLPEGGAATVTVAFDCATTPLTLPAGARALFDFGGLLGDGGSVVSVEAVSLDGGPALEGAIAGRSRVVLGTPINFHGPDGLNSYALEVIFDSSAGNEVLSCPLLLEQREVPTTFYVRAFTPSDDPAETAEEPAAVPEEPPPPTPTPTPNPWAHTPNYEVPGGSSGPVQTPDYTAPAAGGAGGAQSPNYGIPAATPSR